MVSLTLSMMAVVSLGGAAGDAADVKQVTATAQTVPVATEGDSADDPAIWVNPVDPGESLILGTNKKAGLGVYRLNGERVQFLADGPLNNVDVRQDVKIALGDAGKRGTVDLAAAGHRESASIYLYRIDRRKGTVEKLASVVKTGLVECYGFCLYAPTTGASAGQLFAFVNDKTGTIEQWRLEGDGAGGVKGTLARTLKLKGQPEGMVADDERRVLYVGEEQTALWRIGADAGGGAGDVPTAVDWATPKGRITPDIEGVAIYHGRGEAGYLLVSSQGSNSYLVYRRDGTNAYVGAFAIAGTPTIDGTQQTDGIEVTSRSLGAFFPLGAFVAQDGVVEGKAQNFKVVAWDAIAKAFEPALEVTPRR